MAKIKLFCEMQIVKISGLMHRIISTNSFEQILTRINADELFFGYDDMLRQTIPDFVISININKFRFSFPV